jgi:FlaA1/EpsC-like NDP-sugar epimerase
MALSFKGHTVVITGAGGGLGKAYVVTHLTNVKGNSHWIFVVIPCYMLLVELMSW